MKTLLVMTLTTLLASATGFAKSAMESGICKSTGEAAKAGIMWASLWQQLPV